MEYIGRKLPFSHPTGPHIHDIGNNMSLKTVVLLRIFRGPVYNEKYIGPMGDP